MDKLKIYADEYRLARTAAEFFVTTARQAIEANGRFSVALSGGSTPESLHTLLATDTYAPRIDWANVHIFWGDERCVPPDNIDSNYRSANQMLLDSVPIPTENVHRMQGEIEPAQAAQSYEAELRAFFGDSDLPRFDLIYLGLGADGHTASLFPHTDALQAEDQWVVPNYVEDIRAWRLTLTAPAINAAANVVFLVTGDRKAAILREVLQGEQQPDKLPAQMIQPTDGKLVWLLDESAAQMLDS